MISIKVECYSGYKANERPLRFTIGTNCLEVEAVEDQWHSPDVTYFRIKANDGKIYVLRHHEGQDQWTLEIFKAHSEA
jgi:hypothetical protein